jgi:hypothetical protein
LNRICTISPWNGEATGGVAFASFRADKARRSTVLCICSMKNDLPEPQLPNTPIDKGGVTLRLAARRANASTSSRISIRSTARRGSSLP